MQGPVRTSALPKQDSEVRCSDSDYKGATEAMGWAQGMGAGREQEDLFTVMVMMQASDGDSLDQVRTWRRALWPASSCYFEDGATRICRWVSCRCWLRKERSKGDPPDFESEPLERWSRFRDTQG